MRSITLSIACLAFLLSLAPAPGCESRPRPAPPAPPPGGKPITILVASSAREAVEEIAAGFEKETGIEVRVAAGPSSGLARQIVEGAPADLFLAASEEWADQVREKVGVAESRPLLSGELVLVVPRGNPAGVKGPRDLSAPSVRRVALAAETVPAGKYAEEALRALGLYQPLLEGRKIVRGADVRTALGYVERGETEAGLVYSTDARSSKEVEVAARIDPALHSKIVYPLLLLLRSAAGRDEARRFYQELASPRARDVFVSRGFRRLD
jgi:molybdate transport system substrate-binding protein